MATTLAGSLTLLSGWSSCDAQDTVKLAPTPPAETRIFPLSSIHRGEIGVAYTVFEGVTPEPMEVEILGVLKDAIGPGQDMILARLRGSKPDYTGVVAGMSGSPVYIDGKLIGALSYRIGQFSKEPIAGITPIEQMLQVRDGQPRSNIHVAESSSTAGNAEASSAGGGDIQPIATALSFGGFSQDTIARFGERFRALGMSPMAGLGGAAAPGTKQPEPLIPGSAVSAVLVRGDLSISGTCTVTYIDPKQLLACGHPLTQFGPVSIPMTKAEVLATLPSPLNSFKIINTTETVGSFTEDRESAILGHFGLSARMIPVSVDVVPAASTPESEFKRVSAQIEDRGQTIPIPQSGRLPNPGRAMHFEVLNNRQLTPTAMLVSVYQSLSSTNESAGDMSYRLNGELTLAGMPPVHMDGIMAPNEMNTGAMTAALYVNDRFSHLYSNAEQQPEVTGMHLRLEAIPKRLSAVLEGARLDQSDVNPGETVDVEATVHPYQAAPHVLRFKIKLPDDLPQGRLRVIVGDAATLDRLSRPTNSLALFGTEHPLALEDEIAQLNRLHSNDRIYVAILDHSAQAELDTQTMPSVPLSMANVLEPLKASQRLQLNGESLEEVGSAPTGFAVTGSQVLNINVR